MKKCFLIFVLLIIFFFSPTVAQVNDIDIAGYGFNKGIAVKEIEKNTYAEISKENILVIILENSFSYPFTFEILQGENSYFQPPTDKNNTVIFNFAFRIRNHLDNRLVKVFLNPISVSVNLPMNYSNFEVWEVKPTNPLSFNKTAQSFNIDGNVLKMEIDNPNVGYIITASINQTSRSTNQSPSNSVPFLSSKSVLPIIGIFISAGIVLYLTREG